MKASNYFESVGCIVKKEQLATFQFHLPLRDLVLETIAPFPGYYSAEPAEAAVKPSFLFLIIKTQPNYNEDFVIRATHKIKQIQSFSFDASPGYVMLFNQMQPCIRLEMVNYDNLPVLIDLYGQQGLSFVKHQIVAPYEGVIRIKRYFSLEKTGESIYRDTVHKEMCYLLIPDELHWDRFEQITLHIKRNIHIGNFDAAVGFFYDNKGVRDFVRIFSPGIELEALEAIRDKYLQEMSRNK
ncbi:MAG TPA: hypothetical protein DCR43_07340 [Bacteroidales bacterium]|nr:MAG: hypothetical protein A2X11_07985 [Bacteroidetes bacterium GWE2_42_24]OFY26426.1 MAG: hypothetical protein A2X09_01970 [Bacteroidetes bacterium GWF2_43_11]PKP26636.1 MAG: hypothetical protein CVU06_03430 [Bacteroidetes bacterium HGW-Bacteroidetes-22]HAQ65648.1 hypothetical protein [Bacteroidales bacterium]HBZ68175.1 hypothetical protein [Bacteroidales bacterium]